jgi:hypothetical protein
MRAREEPEGEHLVGSRGVRHVTAVEGEEERSCRAHAAGHGAANTSAATIASGAVAITKSALSTRTQKPAPPSVLAPLPSLDI